jgi:excinuclease ABC subunit C
MKKLSIEQRFEDAARVRDRIYLLEKTTIKPTIPCRVKAGEVLAQLLDKEEDVRIIDGIDISNISGVYPVGSVVRFVDGQPFKSEYRRYKILLPSKDDVKMLSEIVSRRYKKLLEEKRQLPDMILIDGGIAQANATEKVLNLIGVNIPVVGLAKKQEWLFLPGKIEPIILPPTSSALQVLQRVRDEAHRFATSYHKKIRSISAMHSLLDDVYGIGIKRKKKLILEFGSVEEIIKAEPSYIAKIAGCNVDTVKKWVEQLKHNSR